MAGIALGALGPELSAILSVAGRSGVLRLLAETANRRDN
jgi:hypothetical protein